jgi:Domain of unknown function (DUF4838)/F5/8 type C domain
MRKISILLFVCIFGLGPIQAQNFIAQNGKARAEIIVPKNADSLCLKAAEELSFYLKEICGADFAISNKKSKAYFPIFIGKNLLNNKSKKLLKEDSMADAFLIEGNKNGLYLAGKESQGDLFAVYTFLEEYLGCMKFNSMEMFVPKTRTIQAPEIQKIYSPAFPFRVPHFEGRYDADFRNWHKTSDFDDWGMFVHTFQHLVPPEKYFDEHPEYFALVDGRRLKDGQLCLSNPELINLLTENLGKEMAKKPEKTYWSVSQNDCINYCECEHCKALYEEYENISGAYVQMANEIATVYPDKQISTLAYQFTRSAPTNIKPLDNVNIMFCSIECNRSMPLASDPRSAGFVDEMKDWAKLTDNIFAWDYVVQFKNYLTPFPNFHVIQPNIKLFYQNGVNMMFQQGSGGSWSDLADAKQYLIAKLLWNPELNADSILNHFFDQYYGKAAPFIKAYFDVSHQAIKEKQDEQNLDIYGFPMFYVDAHLRPGLLLRYQALMDSAELAVADDSLFLKRVLHARIPADFALLDIALNQKTESIPWILEKDGIKSINPAMLRKLDRFVELCELTETLTINERNFKPGAYREFCLRKLNWQIKDNLLEGAQINCLTEFSPKYPVGGESAIVDGLLGGLDYRFNWLGFEGEDMILEIDLGREKEFSKLQMNFLKAVNSWVFLPEKVTLETSKDGINFEEVATIKGDNSDRYYLVKSIPFVLKFKATKARYLKIAATSIKTCPEWHRGFGRSSWIFVDEIILE